MLVKADLKKDYDSVSLFFLRSFLLKMGFLRVFVRWLMSCAESPLFSININWGLERFFKNNVRLKQGDPLSLLLFVLVMECFSRLLGKLFYEKQLRYHPKCAPLKLPHLLFVDDDMIFVTTSPRPSWRKCAVSLLESGGDGGTKSPS